MEIAVSLLHRVFQEEGFSGGPSIIAAGIARRLVQAAIDWCRARGCSAVEVITTP
jgi:GNAT superfamily N-acetyltransferase